MEPAAAPSVVACLTLILDGLMRAIAAKIADYPFTGEMVTYLWNRVNTVKKRILALATLIAAGRMPRARAAKPRPRGQPDPVKPQKINWRKWLPMGRFACLCRIMPSLPNRFGAAQFSGQLRHLLGQPEMRALLAATPKAARILAPLCFMLGIEASLLRPVCPAPSPTDAAQAFLSETATPSPRAIVVDRAGWPPSRADARSPEVCSAPSERGEFFMVC